MIYKERKARYISAFKVPGGIPSSIKYINPENLPEELGLDSFPVCNYCGKSIRDHLIVDNGNTLVCPGSYVIYEGSTIINVMSSENFEQIYEALGEADYEDN